ncbi:MAG: prolyl oligopeptidase family serine peptidase [Fibrobacterota bacterium]|nr:prolyl oligopeptidase family serine peptidase [Fibrobacterota bacterium]
MNHSASRPQGSPVFQPLAYPNTRKSGQVDDLHGVSIPDPYRWLEDLDSPETAAWVEAQNKVTFGFLESIPARGPLKERLTALWNYERYGMPFRKGGRYFYFKNDGLQNQSVLYTLTRLDEPPRVLIDPNGFSADGTVALTTLGISEDGELMVYGTSASGSDWETWRVRKVATGEDLIDNLDRIKFSAPAWAKDGSGFFYGRFDGDPAKLEEVNRFQKLYFHRLGDSQEKDVLVYHRPDQSEWGFSPEVSEDGHTLIISVWKGTDPKSLVFWKDLRDEGSQVKELVPEFRAKFGHIGDAGRTLWFLTDLDAPRGRVLAIDLDRPEEKEWKELVPQDADTLEDVQAVGNRLVASYLRDAHSVVRMFSFQGEPLGGIELPGLGSVSGFTGEMKDKESFFGFTGFTFPAAVYRHDFTTGKYTLFRKPMLDFDASAFETSQVFFSGKDGARIPMFLVHKKGLARDGNAPVYLYGYGGFNISLTPSFSAGNLPWLEMGGVLAVACIRGGGEYGEEWHQAGIKERKQTGFDDFIAAAEYLIGEVWTRPARLAIGGGSNGGLLVAACMVQRPDLFGAVLPAVGVLDMLRFHKFTIGWAWESDYGSPDRPEDFRTLLGYSPLHNLKPGMAYPATLITTADHDDRVVPSHSFKFAAALQSTVSGTPGGSSPALIRIETKAGHGGGKPMTKVIEETADRWAFLAKVLGIAYTA